MMFYLPITRTVVGFMVMLKLLLELFTAVTKVSVISLSCGSSAVGVVLLNTIPISTSIPVCRVWIEAGLYHEAKSQMMI